MKLKLKGRYFELPIVGFYIKKIIYDGMISLVFNDTEESELQIHSSFKVTQYNQSKYLSPRDKDCLLFFYDNFGLTIKDAIADKGGNLWIIFDNETEIMVEDGPYQNWHYYKKNILNPKEILSVHGGVGTMYF